MLIHDMTGLLDRKHQICVVGSGPVGIVVALELARRGQKVTLLESGVMTPDAGIQSLSDAIRVEPKRHADMRVAVRRSFGGTSNLWGAGCIPFDRIDFERRPIVKDAPWPLSYEEFEEHLPAACGYANCGSGFEQPLEDTNISDSRFMASRLIRFADPPSFAKAHHERIASSSTISAYLGVSVLGFEFAENGRIAAVKVGGHGGTGGTFQADMVVLACGGVETTRLLLATQEQASQRFGGENGALGRYYMGHLSGTIADIRFNSIVVDRQFDFFRGDDTSYARRRITASPGLQRQESLSNLSFWPTPPAIPDHSHRDPVLSLAYLALSVPPLGRAITSESLRRLNTEGGTSTCGHVANVISGIPSLAGFLPGFVYNRYFANRRLPGLHLRNRAMRYSLHYHAEHLPNRESRIRRSAQRDALGLPKAELDLRFADADIDAVRRSHEHLAEWLRGTGLGEIIYHHPTEERNAMLMDQASDGIHQIGSARMGYTPRDGVVDRDCRAFDCTNLFLAGTAVFPTSGQANPTLTAIALGIRTAGVMASEAVSHRI